MEWKTTTPPKDGSKFLAIFAKDHSKMLMADVVAYIGTSHEGDPIYITSADGVYKTNPEYWMPIPEVPHGVKHQLSWLPRCSSQNL